jgi:hypothetical protein
MAEVKRKRPSISIRKLKYLLDLMFIPAWQEEFPTGYECNKKTWDGIDKIIPRSRVLYDPTPFEELPKPFVNINEDLPDGFHPIYIAVTPPKQRKKRRK